MEAYTYEIMNRVEDSHWWFVGRRAILRSFLEGIVSDLQETDSNSAANGESLFGSVGERRETVAADSGNAGIADGSDGRLRILDVGCGTGANLEMLSEFGAAEGVDLSDEALEFCERKGLAVKKGSAEALPWPDSSFDLVTALDVIEHLDDDVAGLGEMFRVTKPGGRALFFVPAFMWLWGVQDDISNHRIRYRRPQIVERIEKAGFDVERATYANLTFFLPILAGRTLMKITGLKPESENNLNVSALNGFFGKLFASERHVLRVANFPLGVSIVIVARKRAQD